MTSFEFKTDNFVYGLTMSLIDNNYYDKVDVNIWFDTLFFGSFGVLHEFDINDDQFGRSTGVYKIEFGKPFKTSGMIKVLVETKLLYNDLITMNLLTVKPTKDLKKKIRSMEDLEDL